MASGRGLLFVITNIFIIRDVIKKHNKLEKIAQEKKWDPRVLQKKQNLLLIRYGLFYGLLLSFILLYFFLLVTEKIISIYSDVIFLKTNIAFVSTLIISYVLGAIITVFLLRWLVDKAAFLRKATKGVAKEAKKAIAHVGEKALQGVNFAREKTITSAKFVGKGAVKGAELTGKGVVKGAKIVGKGSLFGISLGIGLATMIGEGSSRLVSKIFKRKKDKI